MSTALGITLITYMDLSRSSDCDQVGPFKNVKNWQKSKVINKDYVEVDQGNQMKNQSNSKIDFIEKSQ